jgi:hypothetical protein
MNQKLTLVVKRSLRGLFIPLLGLVCLPLFFIAFFIAWLNARGLDILQLLQNMRNQRRADRLRAVMQASVVKGGEVKW